MNRILHQYVRGIAPLAIVGGMFCTAWESNTQAADSRKANAKTASVARARSVGPETISQVSAVMDEEVFDRDLCGTTSSCVPNCTTGSPSTASPYDSPMTNGQPSPSPQPPSDSTSPLSDPNSVFSQQQPQSQMPAPVTSLAAGQGASTSMNSVPAFMGDFFGGAPTTMSSNGSSFGFLGPNGSVAIPASTSVGVMKLAENTSPLPRDRVFLSYNYFSNVNLGPGGIAVNRMTPGIEKTFFGGNASIEVRVPMAITLGSNTPIAPSGLPAYDTNQYELGNVTTYFKALLYRDETFALSTGLGVAAPTASDIKIQDSAGRPAALISNQAWHLMPFIGSVYTPNDRWFGQTMLQLDFAANGNSVFTQNFSGDLQRDGALNDPTYLFASVGGGYWMYTNPDPSARLSKVSLISELHFNTTLQRSDDVAGTEVNTGTVYSQIQTLNAVVGTNILLDQNKSLLLGYVTPLGSSDRAFAGEFRVLFNWYFGPTQNRATRVQF